MVKLQHVCSTFRVKLGRLSLRAVTPASASSAPLAFTCKPIYCPRITEKGIQHFARSFTLQLKGKTEERDACKKNKNKHSHDIPLNHHQKSCIVSIHSQAALVEKCVRVCVCERAPVCVCVKCPGPARNRAGDRTVEKREASAVLLSRLARRANVSLFMGAPLIATHVLWN